MIRAGFHGDFHIGTLSITPAVFYDFIEEQDFFIFGLGIGPGF